MFRVESEVGQLRQVIVHRPGLELARLTPSNVHDLLFDDVLWAERALEEHDAFADVLASLANFGNTYPSLPTPSRKISLTT